MSTGATDLMQDAIDHADLLDRVAEGASSPAGANEQRTRGAFEEARPPPMDVCDLAVAGESAVADFVISGLQRPREILLVAGEEGDGKTTALDQLSRELIRGEPIWGFFPAGNMRPHAILYMDSHQELPEQQRRAYEMPMRGLDVGSGKIFWQTTGSLSLPSDPEDRAYLELGLDQARADYLICDAASDLLVDPKDDVEVRQLFDYLSDLIQTRQLLGVVMAGFLRKRPQGEYTRRFDDLFGSRHWKGRASKVLYIEGNRILCFKDRGRDVTPLWPGRIGRYPAATLHRPGLEDDAVPPFLVSADPPGETGVDSIAVEERAIAFVAARPDFYTKSGLADALGIKRKVGWAVVSRLLLDGRLGPNEPRAKLRPLGVGE